MLNSTKRTMRLLLVQRNWFVYLTYCVTQVTISWCCPSFGTCALYFWTHFFSLVDLFPGNLNFASPTLYAVTGKSAALRCWVFLRGANNYGALTFLFFFLVFFFTRFGCTIKCSTFALVSYFKPSCHQFQQQHLRYRWHPQYAHDSCCATGCGNSNNGNQNKKFK